MTSTFATVVASNEVAGSGRGRGRASYRRVQRMTTRVYRRRLDVG